MESDLNCCLRERSSSIRRFVAPNSGARCLFMVAVFVLPLFLSLSCNRLMPLGGYNNTWQGELRTAHRTLPVKMSLFLVRAEKKAADNRDEQLFGEVLIAGLGPFAASATASHYNWMEIDRTVYSPIPDREFVTLQIASVGSLYNANDVPEAAARYREAFARLLQAVAPDADTQDVELALIGERTDRTISGVVTCQIFREGRCRKERDGVCVMRDVTSSRSVIGSFRAEQVHLVDPRVFEDDQVVETDHFRFARSESANRRSYTYAFRASPSGEARVASGGANLAQPKDSAPVSNAVDKDLGPEAEDPGALDAILEAPTLEMRAAALMMAAAEAQDQGGEYQERHYIEDGELTIEPWPNHDNRDLLVAAALVRDREREEVEDVFAAVFEQNERGPALVSLLTDLSPDGIDPPWNCTVSLDFAPYRISPSETAFGVTYSNDYSSTSRSASSQLRYLLRFEGDTLTRILGVFTSEFETENDEEGRSWDITKHERVIQVTTRQHQGFFNLLVKDKVSGERAEYIWDGSAYQPISFDRK